MQPTSLVLVILALASSVNFCITSRIVPIKGNHAAQLLASNPLTQVRQQESSCDSDSDCSDGERCLKLEESCTGSDCNNFCLRVQFCSCEDSCEQGQTCVEAGEDALPIKGCVEKSAAEFLEAASLVRPLDCSDASDGDGSDSADDSNSGENEDGSNDDNNAEGEASDDAVCIGVDMLKTLASDELVFSTHRLARVLCDSAGSCATKGHIVNYKGKGMMMGSYCDIVGCNERVMEVNSPRYQQGLKVESRSEHMHFTAFAARYGTRVEEAVLATAVHVGL